MLFKSKSPDAQASGLSFSVEFASIKSWCGRVDSNHHGIATASPSSWCVCQFRHDRTEERDFIVAALPESGKARPQSKTNQQFYGFFGWVAGAAGCCVGACGAVDCGVLPVSGE